VFHVFRIDKFVIISVRNSLVIAGSLHIQSQSEPEKTAGDNVWRVVARNTRLM